MKTKKDGKWRLITGRILLFIVIATIISIMLPQIIGAQMLEQILYSENFQDCKAVTDVKGIQNLLSVSGIIEENNNCYLKMSKTGSTPFSCDILLDTPIRIGSGTMPGGITDPGYPGDGAVLEFEYDMKVLPDSDSRIGEISLRGRRTDASVQTVAANFFYGGNKYEGDMSGKQTFTYGKPSEAGTVSIPLDFRGKYISNNVVSDTWYKVKIVIPITDALGNYITGKNNISIYLDGQLTEITQAPCINVGCVLLDKIYLNTTMDSAQATKTSKGMSVDNISVKLKRPALAFNKPIFTQYELSNGEMTCNFPYKSNSNIQNKVHLGLAQYKDNKLIKVKLSEVTIEPGASGILKHTDYVENAEGCFMKAFVLENMNNLYPLTDFVSLSTNSLPNVLLLGDSISIGYTPYVQERLKGIADVWRPYKDGTTPVNCADSGALYDNLDSYLALADKWDVIYFNAGLHDIKRIDRVNNIENDPTQPPLSTIPRYQDNLRKIIAKLKETRAKIIFATMTPFPSGTVPARLPEDAENYNAAAIEVMNEQNVIIDDLYNYILPNLTTLQLENNVHFTNAGYEYLAVEVSNAILNQLNDN